ncbi:phenylacetaldehyde synthase-like [Arachis hypogaea]|uniref:phenylacetaldehyde synthase-like n=1 Tax=Arachis hypogaea TaxID=3818 RepID=UPI0010FC610D|nr:tyrosine decarboxylase 2-like [Arachis hypogaea]QHO37633.1 Tyrosine decarboxylase [Arachis hypogaea]
MAKTFEELVKLDKKFEIVIPKNIAMICFRVRSSVLKIANGDANQINRKLLDSINDSRRVYMSHAMVEGIFEIRCAVGATLTQEEHVIMACKVVQEHANVILNKTTSG